MFFPEISKLSLSSIVMGSGYSFLIVTLFWRQYSKQGQIFLSFFSGKRTGVSQGEVVWFIVPLLIYTPIIFPDAPFLAGGGRYHSAGLWLRTGIQFNVETILASGRDMLSLLILEEIHIAIMYGSEKFLCLFSLPAWPPFWKM